MNTSFGYFTMWLGRDGETLFVEVNYSLTPGTVDSIDIDSIRAWDEEDRPVGLTDSELDTVGDAVWEEAKLENFGCG